MNCGVFTSIILLLVGVLGFIGFMQEAPMIEPLFGDSSAESVTVELVPAPDTPLCNDFPTYCVPLVGGGTDVLAQNETAAVRYVAAATMPGVVRGITADGSYFIGNPDAPIRFRVFHNFGCGHCRTFHNGDLDAFVSEYVVTGQAVLESVLMDFGSPPYPPQAAQAALCAGEQGAYWEMQASLYEANPYIALDEMIALAEAMGLQGGALRECVEAERYAAAMDGDDMLASELGVTGTPTVFVSYGDGTWAMINRSYENLVTLTEAAHAP